MLPYDSWSTSSSIRELASRAVSRGKIGVGFNLRCVRPGKILVVESHANSIPVDRFNFSAMREFVAEPTAVVNVVALKVVVVGFKHSRKFAAYGRMFVAR